VLYLSGYCDIHDPETVAQAIGVRDEKEVLVLCIINVFTNKESCGILLHHAATPCSCTPTESIATPGTDENH
jgi:hypothetical protein